MNKLLIRVLNIKYINLVKQIDLHIRIPMNFGSYKEISWTISAERLNNSIGYTKENVVLVCWEFNVPHIQWSKEKIQQLKLI